MSSEPQVTGSTATQNSTERILTRWQADLLPAYDVVGRWLHREPAFLHEHEPEHHLEKLALMTASAEWLTRSRSACTGHCSQVPPRLKWPRRPGRACGSCTSNGSSGPMGSAIC